MLQNCDLWEASLPAIRMRAEHEGRSSQQEASIEPSLSLVAICVNCIAGATALVHCKPMQCIGMQ